MRMLSIRKEVQQELCQQFSSEYVGVNKLELGVYMAVMEMIRLQYREMSGWPEVYSTLLTLLHQYNPGLGDQHQHQIKRCIENLLTREPELVEVLESWLPTKNATSSTDHDVHSLHLQPQQKSKPRITRPVSTTISKKNRMTGFLKYYNFTTPAVHAYLASRGKPARVTLAGTAERFLSIRQKHSSFVPKKSPGRPAARLLTPAVLTQSEETRQSNPVFFHVLKTVDPVVVTGTKLNPVGQRKLMWKMSPREQHQKPQSSVPIILKFSQSVKKRMQQKSDAAQTIPFVNVARKLQVDGNVTTTIAPLPTVTREQVAPSFTQAVAQEVDSPMKADDDKTCEVRSTFPYSQKVVLPDSQQLKVDIVNTAEAEKVQSTSGDVGPLQCLQQMVENTRSTPYTGE